MFAAEMDRAKRVLRRFAHKPLKTARMAAKRAWSAAGQKLKKEKQTRIRNTTAVQDHQIAIMTITGAYTCNPKYIDREIRRRGLPVQVTWIVDDKHKQKEYPEGVSTVLLHSDAGVRAVYGAKIWLDNGVAFSNWFDKKPEQIHIQTMHGSLGIKKLDNAVLSRNRQGKRGQAVVRRETENTDYVLTNSAFEEKVFRGIFWKNTPMLRLGHARTDILFSKDPADLRRIREELERRYGIAQDQKLILYAPTYRKDMTEKDLITDFAALNRTAGERWGGRFITLLRLHPRTKDVFMKLGETREACDVTLYPDIQELMLAADIGITEYSSWIYDYVLTGKPGFLFATDRDSYENKTGLCYPMEETPFPVSSSFGELLDQIRHFESGQRYQEKIDAFLADKESIDDGHAAERIVDWLEELLSLKSEKTDGQED